MPAQVRFIVIPSVERLDSSGLLAVLQTMAGVKILSMSERCVDISLGFIDVDAPLALEIIDARDGTVVVGTANESSFVGHGSVRDVANLMRLIAMLDYLKERRLAAAWLLGGEPPRTRQSEWWQFVESAAFSSAEPLPMDLCEFGFVSFGQVALHLRYAMRLNEVFDRSQIEAEHRVRPSFRDPAVAHAARLYSDALDGERKQNEETSIEARAIIGAIDARTNGLRFGEAP